MSAFNTALSTAKKLTDNVAVAEIPPRFQPLHANDNIAALNANILAVATEMSVTFIPNNTYFFLQSDDINDVSCFKVFICHFLFLFLQVHIQCTKTETRT